MRFIHLSLALLTATLALAIQADPLIYIKNNSDWLISVKPLTNYSQYEEKAIKPDSEEIWEYQGSSEPINGLSVRNLGNSTLFTLTAPEAKKYYLKIDNGANNTMLLKPQEGKLGLTSGTYKYSLRGNIKKNQISEGRIAPTQRMPLPSDVPAPTDMPPTRPSEMPSSFVIKKTTVQIPKSQSTQSQESLISEIKVTIENGPAEFAKPADQRKYEKPADFHTAVMEKIVRVTSKNEQENLKALFGAAYSSLPTTYDKKRQN